VQQSKPGDCTRRRRTRFSSIRLGRCLGIAIMLVCGSLWAQPGSITTRPNPAIGPAIFDAAGNLYSFTFGAVTREQRRLMMVAAPAFRAMASSARLDRAPTLI